MQEDGVADDAGSVSKKKKGKKVTSPKKTSSLKKAGKNGKDTEGVDKPKTVTSPLKSSFLSKRPISIDDGDK